MQRRERAGGIAVIAVGLGLAALGGGALNFTDPTPPQKLEHHRAWAAERGLPAPSDGLRTVGMLALAMGLAAAVGAGTALLLSGLGPADER